MCAAPASTGVLGPLIEEAMGQAAFDTAKAIQCSAEGFPSSGSTDSVLLANLRPFSRGPNCMPLFPSSSPSFSPRLMYLNISSERTKPRKTKPSLQTNCSIGEDAASSLAIPPCLITAR
ncbi:hypothetical protein PtA15_7A526 [Puccinia triticina]|uniref:Uncharacterized protein n=1 Tax=Puccinia triticina TaxID=208348 RepID=A0ABY7CQQ6_9BASI|nr:uncharacterized protein PtA15_7A526 [Puccinia triticina]WAQ86797.1 hypothetical protein PtA15_7A526 [Puccinia triticina]WAR56665.1 hypothetical protein PtB15_7B515 [Puccinia triticina]